MQTLLGLPGTESQEEPRRKPEGGFAFFSVMQLIMAWTALREGKISLKELRIYFALAEMKSRRCGARDDVPPEFAPLELRFLVGGVGGEREAVSKLIAVGLLREVSTTSIEFATEPSELRFLPETLDATLDLISHPDRRVPVPRRIIRLIASGARRTLIATILGHLIRCLFYKHGECHPKGCCKASWIALVFGVCERTVKRQRKHLVELGWLLPQKTCQRTLNTHGVWLAINLAWDRITKAKETLGVQAAEEPIPASAPVSAPTEAQAAPEPPPPPAHNPAAKQPPLPALQASKTATPHIKENKEPLPRGESKNQKPASGGTTGVYISQSKESESQKPTLLDVKPEDLRDPAQLLDLHAQAIAAGYISQSEAERLNFFAAANHARVIGSRNPPGLFVRIVRSGLWSFCTQDDEEWARVQLRSALYPEPPGGLGELPQAQAPRPSRGSLSDDARFVRDITNVLRNRGVPESSAWRLVNRERPEWTRERWDEALAELRAELPAMAAASMLS